MRNPSILADSVLQNLTQIGQTPRRTYQRALPSDPSRDYYFIHRETGQTEPIIVEYGFIDDTSAQNQFLNNNYKELAEAVIKSVLEYKGIPYTPPSSATPSATTYTVKSGDNLYAIAKKYNTTIDTLKQLNNLTSNNLSIGQILKIPSESRNTYTVKSGDTLYRIAAQNNTTVDTLKQLNNLKTNNLSVGQILTLPSNEIIEIPIEPINYTIKSGDTLYSIAKKYNTTVNQIKQLNNLQNDTLTINQTLKIPNTTFVETPTTTKTHIVIPGDTLYSIANQYNTTVNNLKQLNNLKNNILSVGQQLIITP